MAHWDYKTQRINYFPAKESNCKGWWAIDCGCANGLQWGGNEPVECDRCGGTGTIFWHKKSKTFAQYPGGHLLGRGDLTETELNGDSK